MIPSLEHGRKFNQKMGHNLNKKELNPITSINFLNKNDYKPMHFQELVDAMGISENNIKHFSKDLDNLLNEGIIIKLKHKGYVLNDNTDLLIGAVSFIRSGAAFVNDRKRNREVFVAKFDTFTAFPNDKVLVRINRNSKRRGQSKTPEGKIIRVLERSTQTVVGTLKTLRKIHYVEPLRPGIGHDILVEDRKNIKTGNRVLVKIITWDDVRINPIGDIVEDIGPADNPALDTLTVIKDYGLPDEFPPTALQEARSADITFSPKSNRLDLRKDFIFTIDPETARDFDDAISIEKLTHGRYLLGVHIADVSHFVKPGSALDKEALKRSTSIYFTDKVIPMLPEQLSNGICSLQEQTDRFTFSVFMELNNKGDVQNVKFHEAIIRSKIRLTYEQAQTIICQDKKTLTSKENDSEQLVHKIKTLHKITQKIRENRFNEGSLNMEVPEVRFTIGEDGRIMDVNPVIHNESHQLIEECMLLANEQVCKFLSLKNIPHLFRIHEEPDPEKLAELEESLLIAGIKVGDLTYKNNLCDLLATIAKMPQAHAWNISVLRSMKRALYSPKQLGHYGLGKLDYTHFTSPIRRYPDLVIHRILKAAINNKKKAYSKHHLVELAEHCSERERNASEAERDLNDMKIMNFFHDQLKSGDLKEYKAIIVDVKNFGVFLDLPMVNAFGMIHVSMLKDDYYDFNPKKKQFKGRRSGFTLNIGSSLNVIIAKVTPEKRFLDFVPV